MEDRTVRLEHHTRKEFREALASGHFRVAIIPVGSVEQHLEHLRMDQDITCSTYIAERVAGDLYPEVVVAVPMSIGLSAHHLYAPGSMAAKPGGWLTLLYDAIESLVRAGVKKVMVLNGHGGNTASLHGALQQWQIHLNGTYATPPSSGYPEHIRTHLHYAEALLGRNYDTGAVVNSDRPEVDLRICNFWDGLSDDFVDSVLDTEARGVVGHGQEFETAFAMYAFPDHVRLDAIFGPEFYREKPDVSAATAEKGRLLVEKSVESVEKLAQEMLSR